ncbi:hypothetical protein NIASO_15185 [Niabella soli DSM 19437]|uniref:Uncharacterized protein n=1 Tax=Niabella soli DSM 19437 TaxID=929713 RepID=W0F4B1_9BACT|nr:hypothetical protein NIASO_15185 [Niabella soli DSM 19437]
MDIQWKTGVLGKQKIKSNPVFYIKELLIPLILWVRSPQANNFATN